LSPLPHPVAAAPGPAPALGSAHLALLGGDDGEVTVTPGGTHPGFDDQVLLYHTITDTWVAAGSLGPDPPVTTPVVEWRGDLVLPSGETRPGARTPAVRRGAPLPPAPRFGAANYAVLVVYLLALAAMGVYFSRREKTTEDFFLGGRRVPWWAAGISIFGTQLSAITFMAIPALSFATDWVYFLVNFGILLMGPIVVFGYLPFFRRLNVTTAYEYLEHRFSLSIRLFGAASFVVFQLGRMGIVLLLPALALAAVTGMDVRACIVVMAVLCTLYTVLGGIEAVIWTDVLQVLVLFGGALLALAVIAGSLEGGFGELVSTALAHDKLRVVDLRWDWTGSALGVILLAAVFNNLVPYTTDQAVVQRYLTTADERRAASAVWAGTLLALPASVLFFGIGTALFAFYRAYPERLNPLGPGDQVFAWFIVREMPAGLSGLLIAGVFAAAMSSLDSSMNSVATTVVTDFYRRFRPEAEDRRCLRLARGLTVVLGALATAVALWLAGAGVQSLFDQFLQIMGLLGGTLAGLFALGIFTRRASAAGATVGAAASLGVLAWIALATDLSGLLYAAVAVLSCVTVGWLASLVLPRPAASLEGLTIYTLRR
jgi:SSS family transporter